MSADLDRVDTARMNEWSVVDVVSVLHGSVAAPSFVLVTEQADVSPWEALGALGWRGVVLFLGEPAESRQMPTVRVCDARGHVIDRKLDVDGIRRLVERAGLRSPVTVLAADLSRDHDAEVFQLLEALDADCGAFTGGGTEEAVAASAPLVMRGRVTLALERGEVLVLKRSNLVALSEALGAAGHAEAGPALSSIAKGGFAHAAVRWAEKSQRRWRGEAAIGEALRTRLAVVEGSLSAEVQRAASLQHRLEGTSIEITRLRQRVDELEASTSWRVTRPLRALSAAARRLREPHPGGSTAQPDGSTVGAPTRGPEPELPVVHDATSDEELLAARMAIVADALGAGGEGAARERLRGHLGTVRASGREWWFTYAVLVGQLPTEIDLARIEEIQYSRGTDSALAELERRHSELSDALWSRTADIEVVRSAALIEGTFTASTLLQTGVQRVARNTVPHWVSLGGQPVVLDADARCWRRPSELEYARLTGGDTDAVKDDSGAVRRILVPLDCTVLVPELKPREHIGVLRSASRFSGSRFGWIVFDLIPLLAPEYVPDDVVAGFADCASAIKYADRVVAISDSAAHEFSGFSEGLSAQGVAGPAVFTVPLPSVSAPESTVDGEIDARALRTRPEAPLVLYVGSISPHKNQRLFLESLEMVASRQVAFEAIFVAPNAWSADDFRERLDALRSSGLVAQLVNNIADPTLWALYRQADVVVLVSRVEGYGLPIAEALSVGTPVLTSNFGSMAEIAVGGGVVTVDPNDMRDVADQLHRILTDRAHRAELATQAAERPEGSWKEYAEMTWRVLVATDRDGRQSDER